MSQARQQLMKQAIVESLAEAFQQFRVQLPQNMDSQHQSLAHEVDLLIYEMKSVLNSGVEISDQQIKKFVQDKPNEFKNRSLFTKKGN